MSNIREARPKFNRKITREQFHNIGETDTSSPATFCSDSTAIADWYDKIAGQIIPPKALNNARHANHVWQQGIIRKEHHQTNIDLEIENRKLK